MRTKRNGRPVSVQLQACYARCPHETLARQAPEEADSGRLSSHAFPLLVAVGGAAVLGLPVPERTEPLEARTRQRAHEGRLPA